MAKEDIKKLIKEAAKEASKETHKLFKVETEQLQHEISQVAEGVETNSGKLDRLEGLRAPIEETRNDSKAVKLEVMVLNRKLSRKVEYEEFGAVERRVTRLEGKRKA